jgi:hypothetical protein
MRKDDHLIFEALQTGKGVVVHITDHVVDEQEGTAEPGYYPFKTSIKQFDAKHVAHALIKHAYGKLDQDKVAAALQDVLDTMTVNPYGAKPGIIELTIDEFPTDGMVHQVEAKIVNKAEDAENEPHGYPGGVTAIQNLLINQLNKHGFALTKIHHADKERDKYPTVFMHKKDGPMHKIVEIDGMGTINGEPYEEYMADLKNSKDEDAENRLTYNAMDHLAKAAHEIRDILNSNADDEARTEHIIHMAQIILGDKKNYSDVEYRKMLEGLIVLLNRFIVVSMN